VTQADAVDVLDVSFPPRVTNTLEWRINSSFAGEVVVEIRYFTSGIRWAADYVAEASSTEKMMDLAGQVRVTNNSGEDYENSQIRLVVGVIRLVEDIAQLAQQKHPESFGMTRKLAELGDVDKSSLYAELKTGLGFAEGLGREADRKKQIVKEGLSEYFLYTVEGQDTIPNGWSKRLPSFKAAEVPITSFYKYEREQWNDRVMRYYRFTNSTPSKLGNEPLPDGSVKAFRFINDEKLYAFVGSTAVKYIPVNEQVDLELGSDLEVRVKPALMNWEKIDLQFDNQGNVKGWTTRETWEVELQNSKEIGVVVDVRRNFAGDWSIETKTNYEKVDANKIKFVVPLQSKQKRTVTYTATTRHGTNARK